MLPPEFTEPITLQAAGHRLELATGGDLAASRFVTAASPRQWYYDHRYIAGTPLSAAALAASGQSAAYVGSGLPEAFEMPLAWLGSRPGDVVLRIGAGLMRRRDDQWSACHPLERPARHRLLRLLPHLIETLTSDEVRLRGQHWAYQLWRQVWIDNSGVHSATTLTLQVPWSHPLCWFAHPYLLATTMVQLPARHCGGFSPSADHGAGCFAVPTNGGFHTLSQLQASRPSIVYHQPSGMVAQRCDQALDKVVIYATDRACSVEPYLSWTGHDGSRRSWCQHYTWRPARNSHG